MCFRIPCQYREFELIKKTVTMVLIIATCVSMMALHTVSAQSVSNEYQIKSAFLYNFARFVQWPSDAFATDNAPIYIGIIGKDVFGETLEALEGKTIGGRKVVVRRFGRGEVFDKCHVLFVSPSEKENLAQIFYRLNGSNILTVGDTEGFCREGGIINFYKVESKVRFEINLDAAGRAKLKISSKLLSLASIVGDMNPWRRK